MSIAQRLGQRARQSLVDQSLRRQVLRVERYVEQARSAPGTGGPPVLFFNASTRIHLPSLNAAFQRLAAWAVDLSGVPVQQVVCQAGMTQCILGVNRADLGAPPPCDRCQAMSRRFYSPHEMLPVRVDSDALKQAEATLPSDRLSDLVAWEFEGLPLGELVLPGLRWTLRRHDLADAPPTRNLMRRFLLSAASLTRQLSGLLTSAGPRALVVFNGVFFPEAIARHLAVRRGIPVVTHEVGLRPYSAFFSHTHATFRQPDFPATQQLSPEQEARLDGYLQDRFAGRFSMAGIRFWPQLRGLPAALTEKAERHKQLVAVFTNVIFDTSQIHANTLFETMFAWLEDLAQVVGRHPETLFVLRAHPDEDRPGKQSQQSVTEWIREKGLDRLENVVFYGPNDYVSSYDLIRQAKFVLVYNSSIGLEASILGAPVLCAGRARYSQGQTVFFPESQDDYRRTLQDFLSSPGLEASPQHAQHARTFLYDELYRASLDLSEFLRPYPGMPGMASFRPFDPRRLGENEALKAIVRGVCDGASFSLA